MCSDILFGNGAPPSGGAGSDEEFVWIGTERYARLVDNSESPEPGRGDDKGLVVGYFVLADASGWAPSDWDYFRTNGWGGPCTTRTRKRSTKVVREGSANFIKQSIL